MNEGGEGMMPARTAWSWLTLALPIVMASQGLLASGPTRAGGIPPPSRAPGPGAASSVLRAAAAGRSWRGPAGGGRECGLGTALGGSFVPRLRGGASEDEGEDGTDAGDEAPMDIDAQAQAMGGGMGKTDSIQKALAIPEEVPDGWDPDADWELRVAGRDWWKEQREASKILSYKTPEERFFEAARVGAVPWVREMLEGAGRWGGRVDVMARDARLSNWTALHHAAQRGNYQTAKLLLDAGADPRAEDTEYRGTPLHTAAAYGRSRVCTLLVEAGADVNALDCANDTAVDEAVRYKREECATVLMDLGGVSSRLTREEVEKKSVWIKDPLWPDKYNKDLLADSSVSGEGDTDDLPTSELEKQIWWYSENKTFAEKLVEMTDAIPEDQWREEPPRPPYAINPDDFPGMQEEMAVESASEGINPDTSSGWGELERLRIPDKKEGDESSSSLPATVFKGEAPAGVTGAGVPTATAGVLLGDGDVSTCEESDLNAARVTASRPTGRNREKKPQGPEGGEDSEDASVSWSSSA